MSLFHHPEHPHKARNVNEIHAEALTIGQSVADFVANGMGSWKFIIGQSLFLLCWIILNSVGWFVWKWDIYPFIAMNLLLSCQAAYAAPIIMMSQNRQSAKDRLMAEETFNDAQKGEEETRSVMAHLSAQDTELLQQTTELLKQTAMLERHAASIERLIRRVDQATGRDAA